MDYGLLRDIVSHDPQDRLVEVAEEYAKYVPRNIKALMARSKTPCDAFTRLFKYFEVVLANEHTPVLQVEETIEQ